MRSISNAATGARPAACAPRENRRSRKKDRRSEVPLARSAQPPDDPPSGAHSNGFVKGRRTRNAGFDAEDNAIWP